MGPEVTTTPAEASPKPRASRSTALKREVAALSHIAAEYLQSRSHWRARARVAESELDRALDELQEERSRVKALNLEGEGLQDDIARIRAEHEAEIDGRKQDEGALTARVEELEQELSKARAELARRSLPAPTLPRAAEASVAESVPWAMTPDKLGDL